jgi:methylated-DNA-[protein]-cysteine S-methyltransferase
MAGKWVKAKLIPAKLENVPSLTRASMSELIIAYYQSPIGLLKIAGNDQFISETSFVDKIERPPTDKRRQLPPLVIQCLEELIQYFHGERKSFTLPINQTGSSFQQKVWNELMGIPFGKTISYLELSRRLGDSKAIRAAAAANGRNNVAIIVPCHRVIGSNNKLVGYAGGLWRKKWLLEHEAKLAHGVQTLF